MDQSAESSASESVLEDKELGTFKEYLSEPATA